MRRVLVLNGPNLQALGTRQPSVYGRTTLAEIGRALDELAGELGLALEHVQSDHEGVLIETLHDARARTLDGVLLNAAGLTHTSVVLRDALLACELPFVEVHLSNVYAREPFRHTSLLADLAVGVVAGFGPASYTLGLRGLAAHLT